VRMSSSISSYLPSDTYNSLPKVRARLFWKQSNAI
jgi:hypothetical protein